MYYSMCKGACGFVRGNCIVDPVFAPRPHKRETSVFHPVLRSSLHAGLDVCRLITPVPGGVGPMTIAMLMKVWEALASEA